MTDTIIKNATWAISGEKYDLSLTTCEDGKHPQLDGITLTGVERCEPAGKLPVPQGAQVIDAAGKLLLPALFDMHAKVEISGRSKRESVNRTGQAATNGGVWAMLVMPTRGFCFDSAPNLDSFRDAVEQRSSAEMYAAGCITLGMGGEQQAPYNTLAARGVRILSDAEHVPANLLTLHRVMKYVAELDMVLAIRGDVPELTRNTYMHPGATSYRLGLHGTPACAEEIGIETLLRLAADAGARIHIQTVSTAEGVDIIRRAKAAGQRVTAEVALHHLLFTHEDVGNYDTNFKVLPPLRERRDCEALIAGVKDGTIDCIVSDHTPCIPFAKKQDFITAPHGMAVLDHFLPALYTHLVKPGLLTWAELVRACSTAPCGIVKPVDGYDEPRVAPLMLFDPSACGTVQAAQLACGTQNSPFIGGELCGSVILPLQ